MKIKRFAETNLLEKTGYDKRIYFGEESLGKGSLVEEIVVKSGETLKSHYHEKQTEVLYMLNENGYFIINGEKLDIKTGDVLVLEPMDRHITVNDTDMDFSYLCFKINFVDGDSIWE